MADLTQDSVVIGLKKIYSNVADLKLAPDAANPTNARFVDGLMNAIVGFINAQYQQTVQGAAAGAQQAAAGGGPGAPVAPLGGPPPGNAPPIGMMPAMAGGPPPGGMGGASMGAGLSANPGSMDEIRRMLSTGATGP